MTKGQVLYNLYLEVFGATWGCPERGTVFGPKWEELPDRSRVGWNDVASRYHTLKKRGKISKQIRFGEPGKFEESRGKGR